MPCPSLMASCRRAPDRAEATERIAALRTNASRKDGQPY
jgi:hypothetical protein